MSRARAIIEADDPKGVLRHISQGEAGVEAEKSLARSPGDRGFLFSIGDEPSPRVILSVVAADREHAVRRVNAVLATMLFPRDVLELNDKWDTMIAFDPDLRPATEADILDEWDLDEER
jgi:hypothetical protein